MQPAPGGVNGFIFCLAQHTLHLYDTCDMNKVQGLAPFCIFQPKVREQKSLNHSSVPLHEFLESSILHP